MPVDEADWEKVWRDLYGNGRPGILQDVRTIKRDLYRNEETGDPGLIANVAEIKRILQQVRGGWWVIGALLVLDRFLRLLGVLP